MQHRIRLLLAALLQVVPWTVARETHVEASFLYERGWYGAYPRVGYESFGARSPLPNLVAFDSRCDDGLTFIEPRGYSVGTPGPIILDNHGDLVWMETTWGQAMDLKVQRFQDKDYITFWHGTDNGTFGEGCYLMLDETYQVVKKVTPVNGLTGDLHDFRITDEGTALMTIYQKKNVDIPGFGIESGWIFDSIFQEVDLTSNELIFEWRASEHYRIEDSGYSFNGMGSDSMKAFDFYHINSVDKDAQGNYLISSRYMSTVACIGHTTGEVLWQLGGLNSSFEDLSQGAASNFSWNHHASWYENTTLTVFDNGSNGVQMTAKFSRGLMIQLDLTRMTATLLHAYVAPQRILSPSQGSVQVLPGGNVLVGWGHTAAWTEYTMAGEVLCDTHIAPLLFQDFGWVKNYRTFKYNWVGRPTTLPDVAMRPAKKALFVSWNGATEVDSWLLQSAVSADGTFKDHGAVPKMSFETQVTVPDAAHEFVRVAALDIEGNLLGFSEPVSRHTRTAKAQLNAPVIRDPVEPALMIVLGVGAVLGATIALWFRKTLRRGVNRLLRRRIAFKYEAVPMS